jgi:hypothetical protein
MTIFNGHFVWKRIFLTHSEHTFFKLKSKQIYLFFLGQYSILYNAKANFSPQNNVAFPSAYSYFSVFGQYAESILTYSENMA